MTALDGAAQRSRAAPLLHASTEADSPKRHCSSPAISPRPRTLTTVAPATGPLHGCTSSTRTDTSSSRTPSDVYSRPLLLTSRRTAPGAARVVLHTSAFALAQRALRTELPRRHSRSPAASDAAEKCAPCTVTGVPPSASADDGDTELTTAAG